MARQMKDSGIEWIGEIPEDWGIHTASQLFTQVKNKNEGMQEDNLLSLSYGKIIKKSINTTEGLLPESFEGYNIIEPNDIVLRLTDLQNDHTSLRVGLSEQRGIITSAYLTLRNESDCFERYLYYQLHAFDICKGFYGMGAGVRQGLNWDGIKMLKIVRPTVAEQHRIAAFLDRKCAEIDAVIERTKATIEEYKKLKQAVITEAVTKGVRGPRPMKDSGIEWIGEIPEEWEVHQFKNIVADVIDNRGRTPVIDENNNGIPLLELDSIGDKFPCFDKVSKYIGMESYSKFIRKDLLPGDVLFGTVGSVGKCSIVPAEANCCIAQNIVGYRFNDCQVQLFWYYYFQSKTFKQMFMQYNKGNIQNSIKISDMARGKVCVPSLKEQKLIVDFLDSRCAKIDAIIAKKTALLTELETYKKSLIYEYVTGKKEVTA